MNSAGDLNRLEMMEQMEEMERVARVRRKEAATAAGGVLIGGRFVPGSTLRAISARSAPQARLPKASTNKPAASSRTPKDSTKELLRLKDIVTKLEKKVGTLGPGDLDRPNDNDRPRPGDNDRSRGDRGRVTRASPHARALDDAFGLAGQTARVRIKAHAPNVLVFEALSPGDARAALERVRRNPRRSAYTGKSITYASKQAADLDRAFDRAFGFGDGPNGTPQARVTRKGNRLIFHVGAGRAA